MEPLDTRETLERFAMSEPPVDRLLYGPGGVVSVGEFLQDLLGMVIGGFRLNSKKAIRLKVQAVNVLAVHCCQLFHGIWGHGSIGGNGGRRSNDAYLSKSARADRVSAGTCLGAFLLPYTMVLRGRAVKGIVARGDMMKLRALYRC